MDVRREKLIEEALETQKRVMMALRAGIDTAWLESDVTIAQIKALMYIAREGPTIISDVADAFGVGRPAASVLVDHLVERRLVERSEDPEDRRRTIVRLSTRGEELVTQFHEAGRERMRKCLSQLAEEDLSALVRGLRALAAVVGADGSRQGS